MADVQTVSRGRLVWFGLVALGALVVVVLMRSGSNSVRLELGDPPREVLVVKTPTAERLPEGCRAEDIARVFASFVDAYNAGRSVERFFTDTDYVEGPGPLNGFRAEGLPSAVNDHLARRHAGGYRLRLVRFQAGVQEDGNPSFVFDMSLQASGRVPEPGSGGTVTGKGTFRCADDSFLVLNSGWKPRG